MKGRDYIRGVIPLPYIIYIGSLKSSQIWLDAIAQNAWDTGERISQHLSSKNYQALKKSILIGGGSGSFLNYASFMKRSQGAVKLGIVTPLINNCVSLICGILVFSTVFSVQLSQGYSQEYILSTLRFNGAGNSGLTFIW